MIKHSSGLTKRAALTSLAAALTMSSLPASLMALTALALTADDGSPIRSRTLSAQKIIDVMQTAMRQGAADADLSIVELFDYNCGYCRHAHPALQNYLANDKKAAMYFIHFPILSKASEQAAAVQHAVFMRDGTGPALALHHALISLNGRVDDERARAQCRRLGIDVPSSQSVIAAQHSIAELRRKANALGLKYTPTFAIADTSFVGWPGEKTFAVLLENARLCGRLQCS
jgi:protein-disulfide isomerase